MTTPVQFARYLQWHEGDKPGIKLTVLGIALLTTLKSIQSLYVNLRPLLVLL